MTNPSVPFPFPHLEKVQMLVPCPPMGWNFGSLAVRFYLGWCQEGTWFHATPLESCGTPCLWQANSSWPACMARQGVHQAFFTVPIHMDHMNRTVFAGLDVYLYVCDAFNRFIAPPLRRVTAEPARTTNPPIQQPTISPTHETKVATLHGSYPENHMGW